jgi:hypothetical protein
MTSHHDDDGFQYTLLDQRVAFIDGMQDTAYTTDIMNIKMSRL